MKIIATEPRLVRSGDLLRIFVVPKAMGLRTCYVRFRSQSVLRNAILDSTIKANLVQARPNYARIDCQLPAAFDSASSVISIAVSADDQFTIQSENWGDKIAHGTISHSDIILIQPSTLQNSGCSTVVIAIRELPWLRPALSLICSSSSICVQITFSYQGLDETFEYGVDMHPTSPHDCSKGETAANLVAAYMEAHVSPVPKFNRARLAVTFDGCRFVDCGVDLKMLPAFSIIHTLPPVLNPMDTAGFVVLCSTSTPLLPSNGRFPDELPKCWSLDVSRLNISFGDGSGKIRNIPVKSPLSVILSQPRRDEIQMLQNLVALQKAKMEHTDRPSMSRCISLAVEGLELSISRSDASVCSFAVFETDIELVVNYHGSTDSIFLGPLCDQSTKTSPTFIMSTQRRGVESASSKASMIKMMDSLRTGCINEGSSSHGRHLCFRLITNGLHYSTASVLEVSVILRRQIAPSNDSMFSPSVSETVAHGCIPISNTELWGPSSNSIAEVDRGVSRYLDVNIDSCRRFCLSCNMKVCISILEIEWQATGSVSSVSTQVYAFRSCSVQVAKQDMAGRLLINLKAEMTQAQQYVCTPPPGEVLGMKRWDLASSHWQVHTFDKNEWMVHEVDPSLTLVEREVEVQIRGIGFKHALGATLRVCFELEDGKVLETEGSLTDKRTIIFKTPFVCNAQMAKLRVAFDFGNATLWSNPVSFQFCPYPKLESVFPPFVPNSSGGTIFFGGDFVCEGDALQVYFSSPMRYSGMDSSDVEATANAYSSQTRHAMKPGIAPAFAVAMQVRAIGGTSAAAAAAAGAASIAAASGTDFDNIDALVADAVRATGGTRAVGMVASHTAISVVNNGDIRSSLVDAQVYGAVDRKNLLYKDANAQTSIGEEARYVDTSNGTNASAQEYSMKKLAPDDVDPCHIQAPTRFVNPRKLTCTVPSNLPARVLDVAFSKTRPYSERKRALQIHLFTVGGVWPVCGEATGGTVLRISGINFDSALRFIQVQGPSLPARADGPTLADAPVPAIAPRPASKLARTQSFLPRASKSPPTATSRLVNPSNTGGPTSHGDDGLPHMSAPSKTKSMRRTMSVRLGTENKLALGTPTNSLSNETPDIQTSVLFKLASPTTGRILHRTIVSGMLTSLTAAQVANTCLAGASAFSALAGAGESLNIDESHLGAFSIANSEGKINPSPHPSMAVGIAAAEHAVKVVGPDSIVQCRTPPCPLALLMNALSFSAIVEVSFSGPDGLFSTDNAMYEYVRPLTLKSILPSGDHLVPGHSTLLLKGHSIVSSKALTLHVSLLAAPEGGTSHFGHVRTLDRLALSYKLVQRKLLGNPEIHGTATPVGDDADPDKVLTQVCAMMPFFVRRRYFNRHARCIPILSRERATNQIQIDATSQSTKSTKPRRHLHLWVHSQPIAEEAKRRSDADRMPPVDSDSRADKSSRLRRVSVRRQMSSSPQRQLLRQLSRTESFKRSGNLLVRQLSDLAEPYRRLGRNSSQRVVSSQQNITRMPAADKYKRPVGQFRLGDRQLSRSGAAKQPAEALVRRSSRLRLRVGDTASLKASSLIEPDCLINEINIELSPNGQDWSERASRKIQLATPYNFSHVEPPLGPTCGGTILTIYGNNFPIVSEYCILGFLCPGSTPILTNETAAELRGRNAAGTHFIDLNIASLESHVATRKIQAASRGCLFRSFAQGGIPCSCVTGVVVTSKIISCVAPSVLSNGCVDLIVSFDGINFEWAPTEKLRQIRIAHLLLELGIGAEDATAAAMAISGGFLNEDTENVEQGPGIQTPSNIASHAGLHSAIESSTIPSPPRENVTFLASPDSALFETKLHLALNFYAPPSLQRIILVRKPYTDALELLGGHFPPNRQAIVRFASVQREIGQIFEKVTGEVGEPHMIKCIAPPTLPCGREVKVSISMNGGHDFSGSAHYIINKSPVLTTLRPSCGPRSGGTAIFIHGQNFASKAADVKVRFSLATGKSSTHDSIGRKLCTVSAACESQTTIKCRLPPFEQLLSNISGESHPAAELDEEGIIGDCQRLVPERVYVNNSIISLWVDVCILGGSHFTGKPLLFLLYDHFPKLNRMQPRSGPLSGGFKVKLIGNGFLKTNSITARVVSLPTSMDYAAAASSQALKISKLLKAKQKRRRGAVLDHRTTVQRNHVAITGLDSMWPLTSVGNKRAQMRPIAIRCRRYHSDTEVSFIMPWLLGRQPGPALVQVSLNSSEFSEPHERCIFNLFRDHRSREVESFPPVKGPQDVNTSRFACRQLRQLNGARHRPFAHNGDSARNNKLAQLRYHAAHAPYEARPCIRSILRATVNEVDEKGFADMSEVVSLARLHDVPLQLLDLNLCPFDSHLVLGREASDDSGSANSHKAPSMSLIRKLQQILCCKDARRSALLEVLSRAFFVLNNRSSDKGITYGELCDQLMLVLFPSSTQIDLLELWELSDPESRGFVTLSGFLQQLRGERPKSPLPGPSHYTPNATLIQRAVNARVVVPWIKSFLDELFNILGAHRWP